MSWRRQGDILHPTRAHMDGIQLSACCHAEVLHEHDAATDTYTPVCSDCGRVLNEGDA